MVRTVCVANEKIKLLFAQERDRRLIYELSLEDENVILAMFNHAEDFRWEELESEKSDFFDGQPGLSKYLFIEYCGEIVGVFCHEYHDALVPNMEFHIWLRSTKYIGKGIGPQSVQLMREHISKEYGVETFLMRPWIKNLRAIKVYQKCGFEIIEDFVLEDYYTKDEIEQYGNGPYLKDETVNMVAK